MNISKELNDKLKELTKRLSGEWRVTGQDIDGKAEYRSMKGGFSLVQDVDFTVSGREIKIIQHIAYDQDTDTLQAHYMDTMGDESIYTWVLDGKTMRVSQGGKDSDTYFEAAFNDDNSEYVGMWHYPDSGDHDSQESQIVYKRIK